MKKINQVLLIFFSTFWYSPTAASAAALTPHFCGPVPRSEVVLVLVLLTVALHTATPLNSVVKVNELPIPPVEVVVEAETPPSMATTLEGNAPGPILQTAPERLASQRSEEDNEPEAAQHTGRNFLPAYQSLSANGVVRMATVEYRRDYIVRANLNRLAVEYKRMNLVVYRTASPSYRVDRENLLLIFCRDGYCMNKRKRSSDEKN